MKKNVNSPSTVLSNALNNTLDFFNVKIKNFNYTKVNFIVGTQINGEPHIGTYLTQTFAFLLAHNFKKQYNIETEVIFKALDNSPYDVIKKDNIKYQINYSDACGKEDIKSLVKLYYGKYFDNLFKILDIPYSINYYSDDQNDFTFRNAFIYSLSKYEDLKWILAPSNGMLRSRFTCPICKYSDKKGITTKLIDLNANMALFESNCFEHGKYSTLITATNNSYIDLNTLYRNLIKEYVLCTINNNELNVIIKGLDWSTSTPLIDYGLQTLGINLFKAPLMRIFTPQIVNSDGAKLSKSAIKNNQFLQNISWLAAPRNFIQNIDNTNKILNLCSILLSQPNNMFRSYSCDEITRLL